MKVIAFSVYDNKVKVYHTPFFQHHREEAKRMVQKMVNTTDSNIANYPQDFELYELGVFDDDSGKIEFTTPQHVCKCNSLKKSEGENLLQHPGGKK